MLVKIKNPKHGYCFCKKISKNEWLYLNEYGESLCCGVDADTIITWLERLEAEFCDESAFKTKIEWPRLFVYNSLGFGIVKFSNSDSYGEHFNLTSTNKHHDTRNISVYLIDNYQKENVKELFGEPRKKMLELFNTKDI